MGQREDQERLRIFKRDHPEEYAAKVRNIVERKKHEDDVLEEQGFLIGSRGWHIVVTKEGLRLLSSSTVWKPYEKLVAQCLNHSDHIIPDKNCMCGIYAMKLNRSIPHEGPVQGRIRLWGRFLEADAGYRAEFGYPDKFERFKCSLCNKISEDWSDASGFTDSQLHVQFYCKPCLGNPDSFITESKYGPRFFSVSDVLQDLSESYGLAPSWDDMLEGLDLDLEGGLDVTDR